MIDLATVLVADWDEDGTLPELWADFIPIERWNAGPWPVAVFGESSFSETKLNGGVKLNTTELTFKVFAVTKQGAFSAGRQAADFVTGWKPEGVYRVLVESSRVATRGSMGGIDVWMFLFRAEISINE